MNIFERGLVFKCNTWVRPCDATSHEARVAEIQQRLAREETLHQRAKVGRCMFILSNPR